MGDFYLVELGDTKPLLGKTCIIGDLHISSYAGALDDLASLEHLYGSFYLAGDGPPVVLQGLEGLSTVSGDFTLAGSGGPKDLTGLDGLVDVEGRFVLLLDGLESLSGVSALEKVGAMRFGQANVYDLVSLVSLSGLDSLLAIEDSLSITGTSIVAIDGFPSLQTVGGVVAFNDNPLLPTCDAVAFAETLAGADIWVDGNLPDECGD